MDIQGFLDYEQFTTDIANILNHVEEKEYEQPADGEHMPPVRPEYLFPMSWDEDDLEALIEQITTRFERLPGKAIIYKVMTQGRNLTQRGQALN